MGVIAKEDIFKSILKIKQYILNVTQIIFTYM